MDTQREHSAKKHRLAGLRKAIIDAFETAGAGGAMNTTRIGRNPLVDPRVAEDLRRRAEDDGTTDRRD